MSSAATQSTGAGERADRGVIRPFIPRVLPEPITALNDLALDLRWTWSHASDHLWRAVDAETWRVTANPWLILQTVSEERMLELSRDPSFLAALERATAERSAYLNDIGWYGRTYPERPLGRVAFFSMEFGLGEAMSLYAGGLGVLAGDFLKAASDLAVPVTAVGLLYQEGYFRQILDLDGTQIEAYPYNDPFTMPLFPVRDGARVWLSVPVELPGRVVRLRTWRAQVGRVELFLLDSNHPLNGATDRGVTSKLYDAERERRLLQELVLGIGGWRLLAALGQEPAVLHINEGHAAFAAVERARSFARRHGLTFEEARRATRAGNIFTTHTPVAAGFDTFAPALVGKYLRGYAEDLGISVGDLLALGRPPRPHPDDPFNMTLLAGRMSGSVTAVSALHREVTRRLARPTFPRWPDCEIPISYVTNGVHNASWDSEQADQLWTRTCGKERWRTLGNVRELVAGASDEELWEMRSGARATTVEWVRERLAHDLGQRGADPDAIERARYVLDPNALTMGFARRFTGYKRPTLLLHDPERLRRMLRDPIRRVQLIVAGKAHPSDYEGKEMIRSFARFAHEPEMRDRVVFIEDYDLSAAARLVQGVDLWINTPRRPWEACGTSGMKVLVNGGLNLSTLDGWWAEAFTPEVGWALGEEDTGDGPEADARDAARLYEILEREVIPEFYARDEQGLPRAWIARMRASMATLTPRFSATRMLRDYVAETYLPAAEAFQRRAAEGARIARELNAWHAELGRKWHAIRFGQVTLRPGPECNQFTVEVYLGELSPELVKVELYADAAGAYRSERVQLRRSAPIIGAVNGHLYTGSVAASRPPDHYTARVIPYHPEARIPLEDQHILWQR